MSRKPVLLVVDDNATLLRLLDVALSAEGFQVLLAANAQEAIRHYRHHGGAIDLVLMDVNMPGLSGPELVAVLRKWDANLRCCFMTAGEGKGLEPLFLKPLDLARLVEGLRRLLDTVEADAT